MDLFKKLMVDVWVDETVNNSTSFQISISKRLDCFDAVLAKDKSSNILNEKDERDQPLLFSFLHSIIKFISKCLPLKQTTTTVESQEGVKMHGDAETVKYLEACGNAFKIIVATLKPRLRLSINSPSWLPICDSLLAASTLILRQKSIPKDCVTSAAMTFVSALYIRASYSGDGSNNSVNQRSNLDDCLHSLLILVDDSGDISQLNILIKSTNLNTTETHVPVHPSGQSLSMLIKCAITRSIISVFDDDILCPLLLQPPIFSTLTEWCSEPLPEMRQYVLQTLSTLLDRLGTLLSNMTYCGSLLRLSLDIESHLRHLGSLLIASWTHPSRQVNSQIL